MTRYARQRTPTWVVVATFVLLAIIVAGLVTLWTTPAPDPCRVLPRASQAEIARANQLEEIAAPGPNGITCGLDRGKWREIE